MRSLPVDPDIGMDRHAVCKCSKYVLCDGKANCVTARCWPQLFWYKMHLLLLLLPLL